MGKRQSGELLERVWLRKLVTSLRVLDSGEFHIVYLENIHRCTCIIVQHWLSSFDLITELLPSRPLPMQQLLLMFALRPERITQCAVSFITTVLDSGLKQRKLNYYAPVELSYVAKTLRSEQIPLILYRDDPHVMSSKLHNLASKFEVRSC